MCIFIWKQRAFCSQCMAVFTNYVHHALPDQNRNKTTRPGTKQPATKKSNQPDVVSNSLTKASAAAEISRLEALCETRTKELNYTTMQLKAGLGAFDGMAVLVRYLTEQVSFNKNLIVIYYW